MRRFIVAAVLTCSFAIGMVAGIPTHKAEAAIVCYLSACDKRGLRQRCCINTLNGMRTCNWEICGAPEIPTIVLP